MINRGSVEIDENTTKFPKQYTVEGLLRLLVNRTAGDADTSCPNPDREEIVMDIDVDNARYLLVRMPRLLRPRVVLSPREQEIARMVAKGHPNKIIADFLSISSWTVCTHLRRIFAKLGVGSRAAMVAKLLEMETIRENTALADNVPCLTGTGSGINSSVP
jgi:two-component system nitrate/nitrite response regulator NarL